MTHQLFDGCAELETESFVRINSGLDLTAS